MRKLSKKLIAVTLTLTMLAGTASVATAAVKTGTDISAGAKWTSYSIHTREDKGEWEDALIKDEQKYMNKENCYKSYGENAKISTQTPTSFLMNVTSTGWSANYAPTKEKDEQGNIKWAVHSSNPWGVTATKIVNVERGRYYNISFKIKSTLENEITETIKREDGTGYNKGTGVFNYLKHIHFKAYDNKDENGAALKLLTISAKQGGVSKLVKGDKVLNKSFDTFVTLDSKNTADDGWVTVTTSVKVPSLKSEYQGKAKQATMGFKLALGAFLSEFPKENDMHGTIEVKDFVISAGIQSPAQVKISKIKAKKKAAVVTFKKASNAKKYEVQYSLKKSFKKAKTKVTSKKKFTIKKLQSKKKYFVRVRGFYVNNGKKIYGPYSQGKKNFVITK